jgi:hypothetical protein
MSFKTSAEEWVRKGPSAALALAAVAGLVVGGVIGLGAGYKVEQNRTRSAVKKLHAQINSLGGSTSATTKVGQRVGKVTASAASSITISAKKTGTTVLTTSSTTVFETVVKGTIGDVQAGKRILVSVGGKEIIVLPTTSRLGRLVTAVSSTAIKLQKATGSGTVGVATKNVKTVETLKTATASAVTVGKDVFVAGKQAGKGAFDTIEVIVLPAGSGFGA